MNRSPVYGYTNNISAHQTPKPESHRRDESKLHTKTLADKTGSKYTWNQCFRIKCGMSGSGEFDKRPAWRCSCGHERPPESDEWEACSRCGSCDEPKWVEP